MATKKHKKTWERLGQTGSVRLAGEIINSCFSPAGETPALPGFVLELLAMFLAVFVLMGCASQKRTSSPASQDGQTSKTAKTNGPAAVSRRAPKPGEGKVLQEAESTPPVAFEGEGWQPLLDGKSLAGWKQTEFGGRGEVECRSNMVALYTGDPFTGISYTNFFPKMDYEIALDAMRVSGSDFFCGLTFPVSNSFCSLIVGGWGGSLLGLSSIEGMDASENETTRFMNFEDGKWYRIRLRVTRDRIEAWLDKDKVVDVVTKDRRISLRAGEIEMSIPLGICCWQTTGAIREMRMRKVLRPADTAKRRF